MDALVLLIILQIYHICLTFVDYQQDETLLSFSSNLKLSTGNILSMEKSKIHHSGKGKKRTESCGRRVSYSQKLNQQQKVWANSLPHKPNF